MDFYILDTYALIWSLVGDAKLGKNARDVMDGSSSRLVLPVIALAEAIDIVQKRRTKIPDVASLLNDVANDSRIEIQSPTLEILLESQNASAILEMHDRLIAATALSLEKQGLQVAVLTKDANIIQSQIVKVVW